MRILIVGGNGMIGGHAALRLTSRGHSVTIGARTRPPGHTALSALPFAELDYLNGLPSEYTGLFHAVLFAAGNDIRHIPDGTTAELHWQTANSVGIPRFIAACRSAGIKKAVLIGSFYPQAAPELIATNSYVASRLAADQGARALANDDFAVTVLNAPFVIGHVPDLIVPAYDAMARWALGQLPLPRFAPPGGANVISCDTLSDAIEGALEGRLENGVAHLVGDENLSFADYFGLFYRAANDVQPLKVVDAEHPLLPDFAILRGRGSTIYYEPDPLGAIALGYRRNDVARTIGMIVTATQEAL